VLDWRQSRVPKVAALISSLTPDLSKVLSLLAAALICAGLANGLARPERRLDWTGWAPPPAAAPATASATAPATPLPPPQPPAARTQVPAPAAAAPAPAAPRKAPAPPPPAPAPSRFAPSAGELIRELSSEAALEAFRLKLPFLDARRSSDYEDGHLPGAWSVPIWEAAAPARITEFEARANPSPQSPIVIYCAGGDCEDSRLLARKLVDLGYRNLFIYRDGFPDWVKQGRPQERGPRP